MFFEIESDREVSVSGIGVLEAGVPRRLTDEDMATFKLYQGTSIMRANFAPYVSVTAVVEKDKEEEEVNE